MDGITRRLIVTSLVVAYSPPQIYRVYDARALLPPAAAAVKLIAVTLVTRYVPFRGLHISRLYRWTDGGRREAHQYFYSTFRRRKANDRSRLLTDLWFWHRNYHTCSSHKTFTLQAYHFFQFTVITGLLYRQWQLTVSKRRNHQLKQTQTLRALPVSN